jgi:hypothetical protein
MLKKLLCRARYHEAVMAVAGWGLSSPMGRFSGDGIKVVNPNEFICVGKSVLLENERFLAIGASAGGCAADDEKQASEEERVCAARNRTP